MNYEGKSETGFTLGDMEVFGQPPAKLIKALAVIALHLHPTWTAQGLKSPDWSKRSCILTSLTVREFLYKIGFRSADFVATFVYLDAIKDGVRQHSAGIGDPDHKKALGDGWTGHAVVEVDGWVIDTTLYQVRRPAWPTLPGMLCLPTFASWRMEPMTLENHDVLTGFYGVDADTGNDVKVLWMRQPQNDDWRRAPDYKLRHKRERVVRHLVEAFGGWDE